MIGIIDRDMIVQIIIGAGICIGAWLFLVRPKVEEVHVLEAKLQEISASPVAMDHSAIDDLARRVAAVKQSVNTIVAQNDLGRDSSRLYGLIMQLAEKHGVQVQRINPGMPDNSPNRDQSVQVAKFDLTVQGEYERLARFMEAVENMDGFVRAVTLTLSPMKADQQRLVQARFVCEAVSFELPAQLEAMAGGSDAQQ